MEYVVDVQKLSNQELEYIDGGKLAIGQLAGWIAILNAAYDFGHGFFDGFTGRPQNE
jgi:hypothetical protein